MLSNPKSVLRAYFIGMPIACCILVVVVGMQVATNTKDKTFWPFTELRDRPAIAQIDGFEPFIITPTPAHTPAPAPTLTQQELVVSGMEQMLAPTGDTFADFSRMQSAMPLVWHECQNNPHISDGEFCTMMGAVGNAGWYGVGLECGCTYGLFDGACLQGDPHSSPFSIQTCQIVMGVFQTGYAISDDGGGLYLWYGN